MSAEEQILTGPKKKAESLRRCIVTGETSEKSALIRFVVGPDNTIVPDLEAKLPGRGLWVSANSDAVNMASKKGLFAKAARGKVKVPGDLAETVGRLLKKRCLNYLGLASRSGLIVQGAEKVQAGLKAGRGSVLVQASDGAPDGRAKIARLRPGMSVVTPFLATEMGQALGREQAVHVLLDKGSLCNRLVEEANRLSGFQSPLDSPAIT